MTWSRKSPSVYLIAALRLRCHDDAAMISGELPLQLLSSIRLSACCCWNNTVSHRLSPEFHQRNHLELGLELTSRTSNADVFIVQEARWYRRGTEQGSVSNAQAEVHVQLERCSSWAVVSFHAVCFRSCVSVVMETETIRKRHPVHYFTQLVSTFSLFTIARITCFSRRCCVQVQQRVAMKTPGCTTWQTKWNAAIMNVISILRSNNNNCLLTQECSTVVYWPEIML